jgi:xanthine dehydrogenase accessory factor
VVAPFSGVLRGLVHPHLEIRRGMKIGDLDPRDDPLYSQTISDKSLAVGGGVLEAILSRPEIRGSLWT